MNNDKGISFLVKVKVGEEGKEGEFFILLK